MQIQKLVYIRYLPLTAKIYEDFYMREVAEIGIKVEYWDITPLFFKDVFSQEDSSFLTNTRMFKTYTELETAISLEPEINKVLFLSIMTFEGRIGKLYRLFTKYNCNLAVIGRNMIPIAPGKSLPLWQRLLQLSYSKVYNYLKTKRVMAQKARGTIKKYDIIFLGGNMGWQGIGAIDYSDISTAQVVKLNSDDYDNFLRLKDAAPLIESDYILFLDEYLPLHPDTSLFSIKNITAEAYYPQLNDYFKRVETQYGMPVIIAAHPKALKYKEQDYFEGRKVFFGKSAALSKYAYFVLAHDSTSINYPIAFGKRLHFITSKNIENGINSVHRNVVNYAKYLGCNYQWFDGDGKINLIDHLPIEKYNQYKYDFQTWPETENKFSSEIFIEFLKSLHDKHDPETN
jgi:hypothetical protein